MSRVLAVRLDSLGDVLVTGPAVRALAGAAEHLTLLCGPRGRAAAELLPGVDEVLCWRAPWVDPDPEPVRRDHVEDLRAALAARRFDRAVVFTSFHQSPLPTALVLRLAGIAWVGAICEDYPGSLLDVRHRLPDDLPEPERALSLAAACGARLPPGDDGRLAVRGVAAQAALAPEPPYVVLHPGTSVPARAWPPDRFRETCRRLVDGGHRVVVTGAPGERGLTARVAGASGALDLGGRTDLAGLASVLAHARAVVVGNTGPAHLAAAVGTPVVSLFAPTVPAERWAPYGVPRVLLGDQTAPCRDSRATVCPVPGHPCLASVTPDDVLSAVGAFSAPPVAEPA
ncbi:glycosyltransferase family 9 protein [Nocardioides sp. cx-169]|uniref:glycosyltransferase family 9 protein n=1 Tax=Nocardioides sp. cx-169 TaxID=2899080 RepID=UPI001E4CCD7A|nr:glycosyltransferase family 9 protein [Nocardioides sp. cx-169]MCD4532566.1 glycosyltransferase family 9 protein [Nocardioides sp. cx-169]